MNERKSYFVNQRGVLGENRRFPIRRGRLRTELSFNVRLVRRSHV